MSAEQESQPNEPASAPAAAAPALPGRRFQFSLATLLWLTTVLGCLFALYAMYRELQRARNDVRVSRDEVQKYRDEMGYLNIADRGKIHARGFRTLADYRWSWRIYLPENRKYIIRTADHDIAVTGIPSRPSGGEYLDPGEHLIEASADHDPEDQWYLHVVIDHSDKHWRFHLIPLNRDHTVESVSETQIVSEPGSPVALLRFRHWDPFRDGPPEPSNSNWSDSPPRGGFMIWIGEEKQ